MKQTPFYSCYASAGAQVVDFAGWSLPVAFASQLAEHHAVRRDAGVFDVSHLTVLVIRGFDAEVFLRRMLTRDAARLPASRACYTCLLNDRGGVIDDAILYRASDADFTLVSNAATRESVLEWLGQHASSYQVVLEEVVNHASLAVQGPMALEKLSSALTATQRLDVLALKKYQWVETEGWIIARLGYTGEDGVEIRLPAGQAPLVWQTLLQTGVAACGLGARDTLRLEAGYLLSGLDMDATTTPAESNLAWTIDHDDETRDFIGSQAVMAEAVDGPQRQLIGVRFEGRRVPRRGYTVMFQDGCQGIVTSGSYSPTLNCGIALVRAPITASGSCTVTIRKQAIAGEQVSLPFLTTSSPTSQ